MKEVYIYTYDLIRLCEDSEDGAQQATYHFCVTYEVPADLEEESEERQYLTEVIIYPRLKELNNKE